MNRRGFVGKLLGCLGIGGIVAFETKEEPSTDFSRLVTSFREDQARKEKSFTFANRVFDAYELPELERKGFVFRMAEDLESFGYCRIWEVPNVLGGICEVRVLPLRSLVAFPATDDYPKGFYRVLEYGIGFYGQVKFLGDQIISADWVATIPRPPSAENADDLVCTLKRRLIRINSESEKCLA